MPSLKIEITRNLTEVLELNGTITIGRGKDNNLILLDGAVSRHHSKVYFSGSDVVIEDLNSANGILVNEERVVNCRVLQDKDIIKIGKNKIYFSTEIWEQPTREINLAIQSLSEFDMQEIIEAPDVLFKFRSDDESINQIYDICRQKFELISELDDMEKINMDAALNESVGNAQRHGHKYDANKIISLRYILKPDKLIMRVTDQGEGFDYRAELRRKKEGTAVEEARARYKAGGYGGLGIMLMLKCVNKVEYNRKGNEVTLTKYLGEAAIRFAEEQKRAMEEEQENDDEFKEESSQSSSLQTGNNNMSEGYDLSSGYEIEPSSDNDYMGGGIDLSEEKEDSKTPFSILPD